MIREEDYHLGHFSFFFQQFQVQVSDQRTPERTADATVIVNVIKDRFAPQFIRTPYRSATTENTPDGAIIFSTEAIDQDLRVSTGEIRLRNINTILDDPKIQDT